MPLSDRSSDLPLHVEPLNVFCFVFEVTRSHARLHRKKHVCGDSERRSDFVHAARHTWQTLNMYGRRGEGGSTSHRSSRQHYDDVEDDRLFAAAERKELAAQKFDEWVRFKDRFDRGLTLFSKLDSNHCEV